MAAQPVTALAQTLFKTTITNPLPMIMVIATSLLTLGIITLIFNLTEKYHKAVAALGTNGTFSSLLHNLYLHLSHLLKLPNPFISPPIPATISTQRGYLGTLPLRQGPRPRIVNQRQTTELCPKPMRESLTSLLTTFERTHDAHCYLGRSTFENGNTSLLARTPGYTDTRYHGEICHLHPGDGSMHLNLHPVDVKTVVEAAWGEWHPLVWENWLLNMISPVPAWRTLVYCPRDEKEVEVIGEVIRAAAWWVGGGDVREY
jgi:hypothetical protein